MSPANLWQWEGRVSRRSYLMVGAIAFAIKLALDYSVSTLVFHFPWSPLFYWRPFGVVQELSRIGRTNNGVVLTLLLISLPFLWLGLAMTVKRLRDSAQPVWLVCLFFVPVVNLVYFLVLCFLPSARELAAEQAAPWPSVRPLDHWIPRTKFGSGLLAIGLATLLGLLFAILGTELLRTYGWGLFIALPFCLGLFSALLHSYHEPRSFGDCTLVALTPIAILGGLLLIVAIEGLICILMAAPIVVFLAMLGGWLGFAIQAAHWGRKHTPAMLSLVVMLLPASFSLEQLIKPQPSTFEVKSSIEVNAPPEKVWQQVVSFTEIAPPREMLFRSGIAYPIRADISGYGPGAVRHCVFSTGSFVEPITIWNEPRLLRFSVTSNPAPMNELTPYGHIEPPHMHGYFESHQGQFLLTALPGGRTKLEGTTWYSHTMWPETYWHYWSDYVIHKIHMRVLTHIKARSETAAPRE